MVLLLPPSTLEVKIVTRFQRGNDRRRHNKSKNSRTNSFPSTSDSDSSDNGSDERREVFFTFLDDSIDSISPQEDGTSGPFFITNDDSFRLIRSYSRRP